MAKRWKSKRSKGNKKKRSLLAVSLIAGAAAVVFFGNASTYIKMKKQKNAVESEISFLKKENEKLRERIKDVHSDREFVEKTAREQLNLIKEGETVFVIAD
ncbi:MAG: FtsB family cell division protein [Candidatus Goldiibacteriota bacterium]